MCGLEGGWCVNSSGVKTMAVAEWRMRYIIMSTPSHRNNVLSTVKVVEDSLLKETQCTFMKTTPTKLHTRMAQLKENVLHCSNAQCLPLHQ